MGRRIRKLPFSPVHSVNYDLCFLLFAYGAGFDRNTFLLHSGLRLFRRGGGGEGGQRPRDKGETEKKNVQTPLLFYSPPTLPPSSLKGSVGRGKRESAKIRIYLCRSLFQTEREEKEKGGNAQKSRGRKEGEKTRRRQAEVEGEGRG